MKKFIAIILVTMMMSLGMAQAEGNNTTILAKVMARNVSANNDALEQLQKKAEEKVGKKVITILDLNGNPIEIPVAEEPETEPEPQHRSWFQNAIDWVTFWD